MNGKSYSKIKPSLTATISGSNWIFVGFFRGATIDLTTRHLSGAWHVRAIRTHATYVARGVQSVNNPRLAINWLTLTDH